MRIYKDWKFWTIVVFVAAIVWYWWKQKKNGGVAPLSTVTPGAAVSGG